MIQSAIVTVIQGFKHDIDAAQHITGDTIRHVLNRQASKLLVDAAELAGCATMTGCLLCCKGVVGIVDHTANKWLEKLGDKLFTPAEDWVEDEATKFVDWLDESNTWHAVVSEVNEVGDTVDALRTQFDAKVDAAEAVVDAIVGGAGAIVAANIPVASQVAVVFQDIAVVSSAALSVVEAGVDRVADGVSSVVGWISSWRRRLEDNCGDLDPAV